LHDVCAVENDRAALAGLAELLLLPPKISQSTLEGSAQGVGLPRGILPSPYLRGRAAGLCQADH